MTTLMPRLSAKLPPKNGAAVRPPPARRAPVLTKETQAIFARFEKEMGLPLLAYWTSSGGSICQNDVMAMSQLLDTRKHGAAVGLFLKSDGGNPEAALRLVHLLRSKYKRYWRSCHGRLRRRPRRTHLNDYNVRSHLSELRACGARAHAN